MIYCGVGGVGVGGEEREREWGEAGVREGEGGELESAMDFIEIE